MLQATLEGVATFGPMVLLMLLPVLIPAFVELFGAIADRRTLFTGSSVNEGATTPVAAVRDHELRRTDLTKAA